MNFLFQKLKHLNDDTDSYNEDEKAVFVLTNLASLFPPVLTTKQRKESKIFKPSGKGMQRAFMFHTKAVANIDAEVTKRIEQLSKYHYTLQPFAVVVGPTLQDITQTSIYLFKDYRYTVESPLVGFVSLFKCITALHAHYPAEVTQVWQFFHRVLWSLPFNSKKEPHYSAVETLIGQFKNFTM